MKKNKNFYITTPIYYPNDKLHMGHAYTNILADVIHKYHKLFDYNSFFSTGSDEHGQKIEEKAKESNKTPIAYVDNILKNFYLLWEKLNIDYTHFNRTTNPGHEKLVQNIFLKLLEKGHIYKGKYTGYYCVSDETHFQENEVIDGKCKNCGKKLKIISEESYFLKVSEYSEWIKDYIENANIYPVNRKKELLNNFLKNGLRDLSISRKSVKWGIPVPGDSGNTIYVWFDALINYLSGVNYDVKNGKSDTWNNDTKIYVTLGKEITRFHIIYLPIIWKMLNIKLPDKYIAHGWLITDSGKMSKSKGNVIDPIKLIDRYGSDALRFYFSYNIRLNEDSKFSEDLLKESFNTNLANLYGNSVSRILKMIVNLYDSSVPKLEKLDSILDKEILKNLDIMEKISTKLYLDGDVIKATNEVIEFLKKLTKYIDQTEPWKYKEKGKEIQNILVILFESIYRISYLLSPILLNGCGKFFKILNEKIKPYNKEVNYKIGKISILYKRV